MPMIGPQLVLVYEPEAACRARLVADGFLPERALEISSYLAQSTDLAQEFAEIADECDRRGLAFAPVALDDAAAALAGRDPRRTLVWTLTDGVAYFRGGAAPALARLNGFTTIGSDDSLFALCQDKFRAGAVLRALGLPSPECGLARDGEWLVEPPPSPDGWFVKPNRLGSKIGIWPDSHCRDLGHALELSRRVYASYRDAVVVQPYVAGRNVRASFLAVEPQAGAERLTASSSSIQAPTSRPWPTAWRFTARPARRRRPRENMKSRSCWRSQTRSPPRPKRSSASRQC